MDAVLIGAAPISDGGGGGTATLSEVYQNARKLLLKIRGSLKRLKRLESSSASSPELGFEIKKDISKLHSIFLDMDHFWRSVAVKSQRDLWKRKVEQVAEEVDSLKDSLDKYFMRNQRRI